MRVINTLISSVNLVIVEKELDNKIDLPPLDIDVSIERYSESKPELGNIYQCFGRNWGSKGKRFKHGHSFYVLKQGADIVSTLWIIPSGKYRYIDEVSLNVLVPDAAIWVRDIYVNPKIRGNQIFKKSLDVIKERYYENAKYIMSDYEIKNQASNKAHLNYGFIIVARVRAIIFLKNIVFRFYTVLTQLSIVGFKKDSCILVKNRAYRSYYDDHLA